MLCDDTLKQNFFTIKRPKGLYEMFDEFFEYTI